MLTKYGASTFRGFTNYVYFVRCTITGHIKIGRTTKSAAGAMTRLQGASPTIIELIAWVPGEGAKLESQLHRDFAEWHVHGEWFQGESPLYDWINAHAIEAPEPSRMPIRNLAVEAALEGEEQDD